MVFSEWSKRTERVQLLHFAKGPFIPPPPDARVVELADISNRYLKRTKDYAYQIPH